MPHDQSRHSLWASSRTRLSQQMESATTDSEIGRIGAELDALDQTILQTPAQTCAELCEQLEVARRFTDPASEASGALETILSQIREH